MNNLPEGNYSAPAIDKQPPEKHQVKAAHRRAITDGQIKMTLLIFVILFISGFSLFILFAGEAKYQERIDTMLKFILPMITGMIGFIIGSKGRT